MNQIRKNLYRFQKQSIHFSIKLNYLGKFLQCVAFEKQNKLDQWMTLGGMWVKPSARIWQMGLFVLPLP